MNTDISSKLWNICNLLRHEGVNSSEYIEQLTYLLFLKLADEKAIAIPQNCAWESFLDKPEDEIIAHWENALHTLQNGESEILRKIYQEPISRFSRGNTLKRAIKQIDELEWNEIDSDVIGIAFEELLSRVAADGKRGAGQYFTPRPLIQTIVNVMKPNPLQKEDYSICDVAVGTSGFLISAFEWFKNTAHYAKISDDEKNRVKNNTYFGQEIDIRTRRLALMNLFLHNLAPNIDVLDSIYDKPDEKTYSCILTNPPFGTQGTSGVPERDFAIETSNKQLNFIQHIIEKLEDDGQAAIVLPDSCLSDEKATEIWQTHLGDCNVHTILKLPRGTFAHYASGIKACVVFLKKGEPIEELFIYDARTNQPNFTKKNRPLTLEYFAEFEKCFDNRQEIERFKRFTKAQIIENGYNLDFKWMQEDWLLDSDELPSPQDLITFISESLNDVLSQLREATEILEKK
ncbi:MAG: type I restriction-modification system subunit M [Microscillaceae bacterium]|jgi:type I restriction enzyme M protein|nr:type I restriction-modification system subunit M [Microscillaceae bacterium]